MTTFRFTFASLRRCYQEALQQGYTILTCKDYVAYKQAGRTGTILVNRVDIDFSCKKAKHLAQILNELGIRATFFVRLHAPEYNPFSFEDYRCLKYVRDSGHEIGYHSEIVDAAAIWEEGAESCLTRDIAIINLMLDIRVVGVASHRGFTGLNNLDFWRDREPADFGLLYEAYDTRPAFNLFNESLYISDSPWIYWKCYDRGILRPNDTRPFDEHCREGHPLIYLLVHPDKYYDEHFYE